MISFKALWVLNKVQGMHADLATADFIAGLVDAQQLTQSEMNELLICLALGAVPRSGIFSDVKKRIAE